MELDQMSYECYKFYKQAMNNGAELEPVTPLELAVDYWLTSGRLTKGDLDEVVNVFKENAWLDMKGEKFSKLIHDAAKKSAETYIVTVEDSYIVSEPIKDIVLRFNDDSKFLIVHPTNRTPGTYVIPKNKVNEFWSVK